MTSSRWVFGWLAVVLVLLSWRLVSAPDADPDLWGHVQYGQDLLRTGELPATATYTYTTPDHPWINHELAAELLLALAVAAGGAAGLLALKLAVMTALMGLWLLHSVHQRVGASALVLTLMLALWTMAPGWATRPQIISYLLLTVELLVLTRGFHEGVPNRWLISLPPLFALWANTHGVFFAGLALLVTYLAAQIVQTAVQDRPQFRRVAAVAVGLALACGLATLANPYGIRLHWWLLGPVGTPPQEISEWNALQPSDQSFLPFCLLVLVTLASWLGSRRPKRWGEAAVLAVLAWKSVEHVRIVPMFAVAAALWTPPHLDALLERLRGRESPLPASRGLVVGLMAAAMVLVVTLLPRLGGVTVNRSAYPVDAIAYMARANERGRLIVYFDWAQYALAALQPETQVAFDGRLDTCYPQIMLDTYFDFQYLAYPPSRQRRDPASPNDQPLRLLTLADPEWILWPTADTTVTQAIADTGDWHLVYQDPVAQVWRRGAAEPAQKPVMVNEVPLGSVPWPAFPP